MPRISWDDPVIAVRAVLGIALVLATLVLGLMWVSTGQIEWHWVEFIGLLWLFWVVFHDIVGLIVRPLWEMFTRAAYGDADAPSFTIDEETTYLERLLDSPAADRHRKMVTAVRLAEIYRTHQGDAAKADRLLAQYPEAPHVDAPSGA